MGETFFNISTRKQEICAIAVCTPHNGWISVTSRVGNGGSVSVTIGLSSGADVAVTDPTPTPTPQPTPSPQLSDPNKYTVLCFDGSKYQHVDYGHFWDSTVDNLGTFAWELWAKVGANACTTYFISDGYGGAHALLFGVKCVDNQRYVLSGNVWNGTGAGEFGSDDGPQVNEWALLGVAWDGSNLITYYDGVPVGIAPFAGPRRSSPASWGGGTLYIGGSNHQTITGCISQVRGFEQNDPLAVSDGAQNVPAPYFPETLFMRETAQFLTDYMTPERHAEDLIGGKTGTITSAYPGYVPPQFVYDERAPTFDATTLQSTPASYIPTAPPTPPGCKVFDSFSRQNSTLILNSQAGLGSTESGRLGPLAWNIGTPYVGGYGPAFFGIIGGRAVSLTARPGVAWVSIDSPDMGVRVDRLNSPWNSGINTGLAFRVQDQNNFLYAYTSGVAPDKTTLNLGQIVGSSNSLIAQVPMPRAWTTLTVIAVGPKVAVLADSQLVTTQTINALQTASGAGLWNQFAVQGYPCRWDNFTVY